LRNGRAAANIVIAEKGLQRYRRRDAIPGDQLRGDQIDAAVDLL
jgi:hypothetical protein